MLFRVILTTVALCLTACGTVPKTVHFQQYTPTFNTEKNDCPVSTRYECYPLLPKDPIEDTSKKFSVVWVCDLIKITTQCQKWRI